ncbi:hypothetical protein FA13DRAFT_1735520 [Coprinellus micaceus]|uniref:Uncharacterized protein n=1 Tax=Coprinellus micaceus TaxID=71717 RepID=A0A4Y7T3F2_COPMI|nr:hypothetical protein FA13DRAFT_1735520 [Coprinellus micaceus]
MSDANSAPKPLFKTFGAALLGTFIGAMLYGCICMLVYRYFREYRKDRRWFKYMVVFLLLVDTLHTTFSIHYCYYYLVARFQQPEVRASAVWSLLTANFLTVFPPFVSNMFYLSRLWKIGQRNWLIIGGLLFLIIARLALETANQILGYMHPVFSDFIRFHYYVKAYCSVSSVVDTLLAVFIIRKLRHASKSLVRAAKIVDVIVVYLLGAGALTGVVCILSLFASIFLTGGLVDVTLHAILGKLYIISVLAVT